MTPYSPDKIERETARRDSAAGIPQTLLFFILKRLEASRPGERLQQEHVR